MDKGFDWTGWLKPQNIPVLKDVIYFGGNFAKDKHGNYITRSDAEMDCTCCEEIHYLEEHQRHGHLEGCGLKT